MFTSRHRHLGLTLVELLIAISVLGLVAVLGWRGLDSIVRTRITLTGKMEQARGLQLAFAQMQNDCAQLADRYILPDRVPILVAQDKLILIRKVSAVNQPTQLQVISYIVQNGILSRHTSATTRDHTELSVLWKAATSTIDNTTAVNLQTDVASLSMRLWVSGSWLAASRTLPPNSASNPTISPVLPTGLEVTLKLNGQNGEMFKIFLLGLA